MWKCTVLWKMAYFLWAGGGGGAESTQLTPPQSQCLSTFQKLGGKACFYEAWKELLSTSYNCMIDGKDLGVLLLMHPDMPSIDRWFMK